MGAFVPFAAQTGFSLASSFLRGGGKQDRAAQEGLDKLKNLFNYTSRFGKEQSRTGTQTTQTGLNTIGKAKNYWDTIMSGSRPELMAAAAPEINAINEGYAGARESQSAFGTGRGGGTAGANAAAETQRLSDASKALFAQRPVAAGKVGELGTVESQIGLEQIANGLRALGLSEQAINDYIQGQMKSSESEKLQRQKMWRGMGQAVGQGVSFGQSQGWFGSSGGQ